MCLSTFLSMPYTIRSLRKHYTESSHISSSLFSFSLLWWWTTPTVSSYFCSTVVSGSAAKLYSANQISTSGRRGNDSAVLPSLGYQGGGVSNAVSPHSVRYVGWHVGWCCICWTRMYTIQLHPQWVSYRRSHACSPKNPEAQGQEVVRDNYADSYEKSSVYTNVHAHVRRPMNTYIQHLHRHVSSAALFSPSGAGRYLIPEVICSGQSLGPTDLLVLLIHRWRWWLRTMKSKK